MVRWFVVFFSADIIGEAVLTTNTPQKVEDFKYLLITHYYLLILFCIFALYV